MAELRVNPRIAFDETVHVRVPQEFTAKGVDLGAGGIGVLSPVDLPAGQQVELLIFEGHALTHGTVRWGRPVEDGFRLGIQFTEEDWNVIELVQSLRGQEG